MIYYKRFVGDYRAKTATLTPLEIGIYDLMLDECYATERPLPADLGELHRLCRAASESEKAAVTKIVGRYFKLTKHGYTNARVQSQIAGERRYLAQKSDAGKASASKRLSTTVQFPLATGGQPPQPQPQKRQEKEKKGASRFAFELPAWVPLEAWQGYTEMRQKIRRPMTSRAMQMAVTVLGQLRDAGNDPRQVLDRSTLNSWQGLFPLTDTRKPATNGYAALAWAEFRQASREGKRPSQWAYPQTEAAVDAIGGWGWTRGANSRDIDFKQKQFEAAFYAAAHK